MNLLFLFFCLTFCLVRNSCQNGSFALMLHKEIVRFQLRLSSSHAHKAHDSMKCWMNEVYVCIYSTAIQDTATMLLLLLSLSLFYSWYYCFSFAWLAQFIHFFPLLFLLFLDVDSNCIFIWIREWTAQSFCRNEHLFRIRIWIYKRFSGNESFVNRQGTHFFGRTNGRAFKRNG